MIIKCSENFHAFENQNDNKISSLLIGNIRKFFFSIARRCKLDFKIISDNCVFYFPYLSFSFAQSVLLQKSADILR